MNYRERSQVGDRSRGNHDITDDVINHVVERCHGLVPPHFLVGQPVDQFVCPDQSVLALLAFGFQVLFFIDACGEEKRIKM